MKKPEDKIESLYQDKLSDLKKPVSDEVWKDVEDRLDNEGRSKRSPLWWLLLIPVIVGSVVLGSVLSTDDTPNDQKEEFIVQGNESEESSSKDHDETVEGTKNENSETGPMGRENKEGARSGPEEKSNKDGNSIPPHQEEDKWSQEGPDVEKSTKGQPSQGEEMIENEDPKEPVDKNDKGKESRISAQEGKKNKIEDAPSSSTSTGSKGKISLDTEDQEEKRGGTSSAQDPGSGKRDRTRNENRERAKEMDEPRNAGSDVPSTRTDQAKESELKTMLQKSPVLETRLNVDSLDPLTDKLEEQDEVLGPAIGGRVFYLDAWGGVNQTYRVLKDKNKDRSMLRNDNEEPITAPGFGIDLGTYLYSDLNVSLGVGYEEYGSDLSFSGSTTVHDTDFTQNTQYNYVDSSYTVYDSVNQQWDTITVIVDTVSYQTTDTTVTSKDSSYSHDMRNRYEYFTVPLMVSYDLDIGDRFIVAPSIGVGMNILYRERAGWVEPTTHEPVNPKDRFDAPFRSVAFTYRGRLEFKYKLNGAVQVGVGVSYARFFSSIYKEEVGMVERPYRFGGELNFRYILSSP